MHVEHGIKVNGVRGGDMGKVFFVVEIFDLLTCDVVAKGRLTLPTGDVYEGGFAKGKRSGNGTMYYKKPQQGVVYKGEWAKDKREGYGSVTWPDGTYFQGKWERG